MATATHSALDGSTVSFGADADLSAPMTAFGFVRPRGWERPQPLNVLRAGMSERVQAVVSEAHPEIEYTVLGETEVNGGTLRMAEVRRPTATGGRRQFVYGVWEGSDHALTTSVRGDQNEMEDLFDRLEFRELPTGIAVDSPVDESIRSLRCLKEVGTALLEVRPRSPEVARSLPSRPGLRVANGEVFLRTKAVRDVLLVTETAAVVAIPLDGGNGHLDLAAQVEVNWSS